MKSDSSHTISNWMDTAVMLEREPLQKDLDIEVGVIGGGIAGLSVAYHLAKAGVNVAVFDDGPFGAGETSRTTAHLSCVPDDDFQNIWKTHGEEGLRYAYESHRAAIDTIEAISQKEGIACDFVRLPGYLFSKPHDDVSFLANEFQAAKRAGFQGLKMMRRVPLPGKVGGEAICFPNQARFHVLKYLDGLAKAIERHGGKLYGNTHVKEMKIGKDSRAVISTESGFTVRCDHAVACVNSPMAVTTLNFKQFPYRTFAIAGPVPYSSVEDALYWDTEDPYHYVRLQPQDRATDLLIVGGEDHKTGEADDAEQRYQRLEAWAREHFPMLGEIQYQWSGQVMEPVDGLAYIGRIKPGHNLYLCTGDSGMGMTHGSIAGLLISDLILGKQNPWETLYSPNRPAMHSPLEWAREIAHTATQGAKYVSAGDVSTEEELLPGQGAVIRHGLSKEAVYRDEAGALHKCSAVCTHMKCIVSWNSGEKSWDCGCHGSRFDIDGRVLNGPAVEPLKALVTADEQAD